MTLSPSEGHVVIAKSKRQRDRIESPSRLEKNIHSLMLHSLSEDGLGYPHVQRTTVGSGGGEAPQRSGDPRQGGYRPIILCKTEGADNSCLVELHLDSFRSNSQRDSYPECDKDAIVEEVSTCSKKKSTLSKARKSSQIRKDHPLHVIRRKSSEQLVNANVDESFRSVRSKIDHRTLAILDKSRALIGQTPQLPETRESVAELRHRYRASVQKSIDDDSTREQECEASESVNHQLHDPQTNEMSSVNTAEELTDRGSLEANTTNDRLESNIRCDIELLQPPEDPPEDENEWENELARQILTIYATSVKAKAVAAESASNRPSSSSSHRNARTPTRATRRPGDLSACSLPALNQQIRGSTTTEGSQPLNTANRPNASVNYSWEPSQRLHNGKVIVNMPSIPKPVWFAGTGAVKAVWCALTHGYGDLTSTSGQIAQPTSALCSHRLCEEVRRLEAQQKYLECVTSIESLMIALVRARGASELEIKLWKQLVVTCNAFASRCIDYKRFPAALKLMKQAEHLVDNSVLVDSSMRLELLAYLYDTYAHYYYRRRKPNAGFEYCRKALEIHSRQSSWAHVAKTRLHVAALLSFQKKHTQALAQLASVLELIESNKLEEGGASGQKLCLVAVCYNNLAVEQLHQRAFEAAGVAAENAQRLARLCLSYSNRWLAQLDATRQCVALAVATLLEPSEKV